jgi:hypothetical protein
MNETIANITANLSTMVPPVAVTPTDDGWLWVGVTMVLIILVGFGLWLWWEINN